MDEIYKRLTSVIADLSKVTPEDLAKYVDCKDKVLDTTAMEAVVRAGLPESKIHKFADGHDAVQAAEIKRQTLAHLNCAVMALDSHRGVIR